MADIENLENVVRVESDVKCIASKNLEKAVANELNEETQKEDEQRLKLKLKG